MNQILHRHQVSQWELNVADLGTIPAEQEVPMDPSTIEVFNLPVRPGEADSFQYKVIMDRKSRKYWIIRTGGIAGRTSVFGPGHVDP
jgi:hypothetical protein